MGWRWLCWPYGKSGAVADSFAEKGVEGRPLTITLVPCDRTIQGNCVDPQGRPLAGASVTVVRISDNDKIHGLLSQGIGSATSDADGRYSIKIPEYRLCDVVAEHIKYVPVEASYSVESPGPKQIAFKEPAGMVQGRVVEAATGTTRPGSRNLCATTIVDVTNATTVWGGLRA